MPGTEHFVFGGREFEWNAGKSSSDVVKHRVHLAEGATPCAEQEALMIADPDHLTEESRFILVGMSRMGRILVVVCAERGDRFGSSVRVMRSGRERSEYEERRWQWSRRDAS